MSPQQRLFFSPSHPSISSAEDIHALVLHGFGGEAGKCQTIKEHVDMRQMTMTLAFVAAVALTATSAQAISKKVERDCAGDYQNFCSQYAPGTAQLRDCFESNRKGLSQICVRALVDAGEVPAKYLKK
jgi:hypothetical protein